jgi:hypothetical protein
VTIFAIVVVIVLGLALAVVVAIARDKGPGPDDVAVAYELAWDHLDFESVFTLSAAELRDGLDRRAFVKAKKAAYEQQHALRGLVARVGIDEAASNREAAVVITRVELSDHAVVHNRVELARRNARWQVVAYRLEPSDEDSSRASS